MEYYSEKTRNSHIENVERLINNLGNSHDIDYLDYREIVNYLNSYRNVLLKENEMPTKPVPLVNFTGLEEALHQFNENGIRGESNRWTVVRGSYDEQFEIHYNGYTVLDCVSNMLRGGYRPMPEWNDTVEQHLKDIVSATYGIEQVKTISSLEELKAHIESMDWRVEDCAIGPHSEAGWELYQYSPAGEDFSFAICHNNDLSEAIEEIGSYAYNFDVDEHIEMWIEARNNNVGGVPDTRTLVEDAQAIQKMLEELADSCNALNIEEKEADNDIADVEPDICDD